MKPKFKVGDLVIDNVLDLYDVKHFGQLAKIIRFNGKKEAVIKYLNSEQIMFISLDGIKLANSHIIRERLDIK